MSDLLAIAIASHPGNDEAVDFLCDLMQATAPEAPIARFRSTDSKGVKSHLANVGFHEAAGMLADRPFLWMEADVAILRRSWYRDIACEYYDLCPREDMFLLPQRNGCITDVASGIGVYPKGTIKMLPPISGYREPIRNWDVWVERNLAHLIVRTNLIQHSYADYTGGRLTHHRFPTYPNALGLPHRQAVLFHADKHQDINRKHIKL